MSKYTICLDFDGVIHAYRHGWKDGTVYDAITDGFFEWAIEAAKTYRLVIHSSRNSTSIREWLSARAAEWHEINGHDQALPDFEFSGEKPPAYVSIDDRALTFTGDWSDFSIGRLSNFRPWNVKKSPIQALKEVTKQACAPGNADHCEYMRGLANGLILARAIMLDETPAYVEKPAEKESRE
jgi:hypothetical protein